MTEPGQNQPTSDFNSRKPFGSAARLYREAGWLGALPLPKGKKNPPPKGYTGAGKEYPTEAKVESWLSNKETCYGNIGLRLAEVDREFWPSYLPAVYAGNAPDGWELIGIDIDDYKGKEGGNQREALEYQLDCELPATALSSARWGSGGSSCIAIYFVPKGYRFMGKAADSIEIVQKRHRYMVAWPSVNPDAPTTITEVDGKRVAVPARYSWRYGKPSDVGGSTAAGSAGSGLVVDIDGIPSIKPSEAGEGVAVLPEAWFKYLSRQGERETDDAISSLSEGELTDWAKNELRWEGEPCKRVSNALAKAVAELEDSPDSHTWLNSFLWQLFNLAAEGHSGIGQAYSDYMNAWVEHAGEHRGASPEDLKAEIERSVLGALSKIEPKYVMKPDGAEYADDNEAVKHLPLRDDICSIRGENEHIDALGPLGPMSINPCKPADQYNCSDSGNAEHFADLYGGNVHYYAPLGSWMFWTGTEWHKGSDELAMSAFRRVRYAQMECYEELWNAVGMYDPSEPETKAELKTATNAAKKMENWYTQSGNYHRVIAAARLLKTESRRDKDVLDDEGKLIPGGVLKPIMLQDDIFDQKLNLLACSNGVLDLNDLDAGMRPQRKDDYISMNTGVQYVSWSWIVNAVESGEIPAESPIGRQYQAWIDYLALVHGDDEGSDEEKALCREMREDMQMILGYTIIGGNPARKLIFVEGQGGTGKSTMLEAIQNALGDYCGTTDEKVFSSKGQFNESLASHINKRVLKMSEPSGDLHGQKIKELSGNEGEVEIRIKYKNETKRSFVHFTGLVACNKAPSVKDNDPQAMSRMASIMFNRQIKIVANREEKHRETVNANIVVLSWLVDGYAKYRARANELAKQDRDFWMCRPEAALEAQKSFTADMDVEGNVIEEFIRRWAENRCDTKKTMPAEWQEAYSQAEAKAKEKKRARGANVGAADWPIDWVVKKKALWDALRADATANGIRLFERVHGAILLESLGIEPADAKLTRRLDGVPHAVFVGVRFRNGERKLGKW